MDFAVGPVDRRRLGGDNAQVMDPVRVDLLLQYALACAAQREPPANELSRRALVLYVYAADLGYAQAHGESYTGASWRFGARGLEAPEVEARVTPATAAIGVAPLRSLGVDDGGDEGHEGEGDVEGDEDGVLDGVGEGFDGFDDIGGFADLDDRDDGHPEGHDRQLYPCRDRGLLEALDPQLPLRASRALRRAFRTHGADLRGLVAELLRARPLIQTAPGEPVDMTRATEPAAAPEPAGDGLTAKQRKRRGDRLRAAREALVSRREARGPGREGHRRLFLPTYDPDVLAGLAEVAGLAPALDRGDAMTRIARVDPAVWRAPLRSCDDVP